MLIRRRTIAVFAGVFLVGALAGGLLVFTFRDARMSTFLNHAENPQKMAGYVDDRLARQFSLSPDELKRVAPLVKEMSYKVNQQRRDFGINVINTLNDYHGKIEAAMDPDHRAAYRKDIEARTGRLAAFLLLDQNPPPAAK